MKALSHYSHIGLRLLLAAGVLLAILLCVQSVRTYIYIGSVLVPQEAEREAHQQVGELASLAHEAGVTETRELAPLLERSMTSGSSRPAWLRLIDPENAVIAKAGAATASVNLPSHWWERQQKHVSPGRIVNTANGKLFVALLPFRLPRPPRPAFTEGRHNPPDLSDHPPPGLNHRRGAGGSGGPGLILEVAIPLDSVTPVFAGLRQNVVVAVFASIALLLALLFIGLRTPHYLRGKYLERELQLARQVQSDLQPKPISVSSYIEFAAAAAAADHIGGDFYDVFETSNGQVAIVLGDVSGKGVSAALLVSVLQGAIRSSSSAQHEIACERINRMLCERTAAERFATLFWGVLDPLSATFRYVNAGHAAPILVQPQLNRTERLTEGGLVLGMLPTARYSAGTVQIQAGDTLIVYSDGINEATNAKHEEFGEDRIMHLASSAAASSPAEICDQIMHQLTGFATTGQASDDRTLMVVRFPRSKAALSA
jgi:hypothetical protein